MKKIENIRQNNWHIKKIRYYSKFPANSVFNMWTILKLTKIRLGNISQVG